MHMRKGLKNMVIPPSFQFPYLLKSQTSSSFSAYLGLPSPFLPLYFLPTSGAPYKCGECRIALFVIFRTFSHYLALSALFRTISTDFCTFSLFPSFHTVLHYSSMKTSEKVGKFWHYRHSKLSVTWEVLVLW